MGINVDLLSRASSENRSDLSFHYGVFNYRPQRSWGKVIFSQASVILLTGDGASSRGGGASSWGVLPGGVLPPRGELPPVGRAWWRRLLLQAVPGGCQLRATTKCSPRVL